MDKKTITQYNKNSAIYSTYYNTLKPENLYETIKLFFKKKSKTADIGCGNGRDALFLKNYGCIVTGYDASYGMIQEAKMQNKNDIKFIKSELPELREIENSAYTNVLCSAVLMHLSKNELFKACKNLFRILCNNGILILSIRTSRLSETREPDGRLFTNILPETLISIFKKFNGELLYKEIINDSYRENIKWSTLVFKK